MTPDDTDQSLNLSLTDIIYTEFESALSKIVTPQPGDIADFIFSLQDKLDEHLEENPPDAPSLNDILSQ